MVFVPLRSKRGGVLWIVLVLLFVIALFLLQMRFVAKRNHVQNMAEESVESPATQHGEYQIITNPAAAVLIVDGEELGKTPFTVKDVVYGSMVVEIRKPGYQSHTETILVNSSQPQRVSVTLLPRLGSLQLTSTPSQATIVINGQYRGTTPLTINNLPLGYLDLVVEKGCYRTIQQQVEVSDKRAGSFDFPLEYSCGNLEVTSIPSGAEVFVAGKRSGITPYTMTGVKVGEIELLLKAKGHESKKKLISIKSGQTVREMIIFDRPKDPEAGDIWQEPETGIEFVWVKGGCYQMGNAESDKLRVEIAEKQKHRFRSFLATMMNTITDSDTDEEVSSHDLDEAPVHEVCVSDGWVATKEVTNEQFLLFSTETGSKPEWQQEKNEFNVTSGKNTYYTRLGGDGFSQGLRPVVGISWQDTQKFTSWFSRKTGYRARLLTEAEWEYACRSGGKDEEFSGGDVVGQYAWNADNSNDRCHDVGQLQANGVGLYDMSGNVWEWVMDTYDPGAYEHHEKMNPVIRTSPETQMRKVVRGGSWRSKSESLSCTSRYGLPPDDCHVFLGFRIMMVEKTQ